MSVQRARLPLELRPTDFVIAFAAQLKNTRALLCRSLFYFHLLFEFGSPNASLALRIQFLAVSPETVRSVVLPMSAAVSVRRVRQAGTRVQCSRTVRRRSKSFLREYRTHELDDQAAGLPADVLLPGLAQRFQNALSAVAPLAASKCSRYYLSKARTGSTYVLRNVSIWRYNV